MKKTLLRKALNRSIKQSFGRFLSIFMIIALGASLFSGLRNTPASMEASVSKDVKAAHFADLTYIATLGYDQDDIEEQMRVLVAAIRKAHLDPQQLSSVIMFVHLIEQSCNK